jgi:hypothetical protein
MAMTYGLTIPHMNLDYEAAWIEAGLGHDVYSSGGGSTEWTFNSKADKQKAREIAAKIIIRDFDFEALG